MKFLVDENLPPAIARFIDELDACEAKHINDFGNELPISDNAIRRFALHQNWVVITRDDDFVKSYVNRKVPEKLIYLFGFSKKNEILESFQTNWNEVFELIECHELIEVNPNGIKVHF